MSDTERIEGIKVLGICIETLKDLLLDADLVREEATRTMPVLIARMRKLAMEMS